ncbi:MAG TPA: thioredoxin family protein [Polyangiaceae bacterium]|nr:thioredoxin family protein [Polyangiaceae bacterium]
MGNGMVMGLRMRLIGTAFERCPRTAQNILFAAIVAASNLLGCAAQGRQPTAAISSPPPVNILDGRAIMGRSAATDSLRSGSNRPRVLIEPDVSTVVADASSLDKPILLYFGAVWCEPCVQFERTILSQPEVAGALSDYRFQKYDPDTGAGMDGARQFDVRAFPTLIFLSPKGLEVDRPKVPKSVEHCLQMLREMQPIAKSGPLDESQISSVKDARRLIASARAAENASKLGLALRFYRAATAASLNQGELAADAEMGRLRVETQLADKKKHAELLFAFVTKYPTSPRAVDALAGLAGFAQQVNTDTKALLRVATKTRVAMTEQKDVVSLRRLALVLQKLGDTPGATEAEKTMKSLEASGSGAPTSEPPSELFGFRDPLALGPLHVPHTKDLPPEMRSKIEAMDFDLQLGRQVMEECKESPRRGDEISVRIYVKGDNVERAVVLDPEAPPELKECLERAVLATHGFPATFGERHEVRVTFK